MKYIQDVPTCLPLPAGRRGQAGKTDAAIPKKPLMIIFLPAGRLEVSFRAIADFKLVDKMEKFGYQKIEERL